MDEPSPRPPLDYFAPHAPDRRRARGVVFWSTLLLLSWVPYLCGVVNASTVTQSYVPDITHAHANASAIGLIGGLLLSVASLVWFARQRHWAGVIAASGVVLMQAAVAGCIGATG
jgi:hypothetical protein